MYSRRLRTSTPSDRRRGGLHRSSGSGMAAPPNRPPLPPELGVPPTNVIAVASGNGAYRASGLYTPMTGLWQPRVQLSDCARCRWRD
jgi:hypothetical protein